MKSIIIPDKLDKWWTAAILLDFFFFQIHNFGESHTNCYTFIKQSWFSASMVFLCGKSFCGSQIVQFLSKYDQLPVTYKVMETTESCVTYKGVHVANNTVASSNPCTRKKKLFKKIWWTIRLRQEVLAAIQQLKKKVILSLCKILACTWITVEQKMGGKNNRARLSGSVCISDAVLYSERVSELRWEQQLWIWRNTGVTFRLWHWIRHPKNRNSWAWTI